ncbi:MAG: hypothetical protein ACTSPW_19000 [Promethearchaeota archaeon]
MLHCGTYGAKIQCYNDPQRYLVYNKAKKDDETSKIHGKERKKKVELLAQKISKKQHITPKII